MITIWFARVAVWLLAFAKVAALEEGSLENEPVGRTTKFAGVL
jgi:hypothetical protein